MTTKQQLQTMSDFEVNKALAVMIYGYPEDKDIAKRINSGDLDFCNTPNDIMPLAFEHKISLEHIKHTGNGYWIAGLNTFHHVAGDSPLRAIACCLILVLQGRKL